MRVVPNIQISINTMETTVHFRWSTPDLTTLGDMQDRMMYWEDKTADCSCDVFQLARHKNDPEQKWMFEDAEAKWAIASHRLKEIRDKTEIVAKKVLEDNQWKGDGCMNAVITRTMLEIVCAIDNRRMPVRTAVTWHPRGWTDEWVTNADLTLVKRVVDLGLLKPRHGDAFWWFMVSDNMNHLFFWHETKGVMRPDISRGIRRGEVPKDFLEMKKSGVYRSFDPPIKHD